MSIHIGIPSLLTLFVIGLHPEPHSRISGIITHSVRNDFTGFAVAAFIAW